VDADQLLRRGKLILVYPDENLSDELWFHGDTLS
jgi:hypothetical protein